MTLANRLHKSVKEIMEMTTLELSLWAGYMEAENKERMKTMQAQKNQARRR